MFPGVVTVGYERHCHTLEHQGNAGRVEDADPIAREACRQIHAWYTVAVRRDGPQDEGHRRRRLDRCSTTRCSSTPATWPTAATARADYPALLVGKAGGTLKTGRQIDFEKQTPVANLYVEMLDRMGAKVKTFGESATSNSPRYDGRLPGLVLDSF